MAQRPEPVGGFPGRAIGHAGFPQMAVGGTETTLDFGWCQRGEGIEEPGPDRAGRAILSDIFIGNAGQADVVARPLPCAPVGGRGLAPLAASMASLYCHPDSPASGLLGSN